MPTDVARYQTERVVGVDTGTREVLERVLSDRAQAIAGTAAIATTPNTNHAHFFIISALI